MNEKAEKKGAFGIGRVTRFYLPLLLQAFSQSVTYPLVAGIVTHGAGGVNSLTAFSQGQLVMFIIGAFGLGIICHFIFMNWADFANSFSGEHSITVAKCSSNTVFIQGILCGALVYIAVYCYKNFENWAMKIIGIIVSVTLFVYCGFQHCIANMFYFAIEFNWNIDILWNLLIVILTNSVGALLVRCLVHLAAIVMPKKEER